MGIELQSVLSEEPGHTATGMVDLVIGGARSGKSLHAERLADDWWRADPRRQVVYVATAAAGDGEMAARIEHHRARRPAAWGLIEAPLALADTLRAASRPDTLLLVDCLTLWLSNLLFSGAAAAQAEAEAAVDCQLLAGQQAALLDALTNLPGPVVLVSNEVGWGIVPMGALSRLFVDEQGRLNQRVAAQADRVTLVAAGLPLLLKGRAG
jgi:adenosylcobinamide kinase/adenosylcobinamide-phosphate guanylyltransferase